VTSKDGILALADVRDQADRAVEGTDSRDVLSAFNTLATRLGVKLEDVPATAPEIRELFDTHGPTSLRVTPKRYANIRFSATVARLAAPLPGHRDFRTTERHYVRAEQIEASRRINAMLQVIDKAPARGEAGQRRER
jgi:hypothetical protein